MTDKAAPDETANQSHYVIATMNDHPARSELFRQAAEREERQRAAQLTTADLAARVELDRDDVLPAREIAAALLGLNARRQETYIRWATDHAAYVQDAEARGKLQKLVKWTRLLVDELKAGPDGRVRVDKALGIAADRGWARGPQADSADAATNSTMGNASGAHAQVLDREIAEAINRCGGDYSNAGAVFAELKKLADDQFGCLVGSTGHAVKYENNDGGQKLHTLKNLRDRLARKRDRAR